MATAEEAQAYCASLVEKQDRERFLTVLFAPPPRRPALLALYAFNHEIAKTRDVVRETAIGAIRLQWWHESLDGIAAGTPRQHQVVQALAATPGLDLGRLHGMIEAREMDFGEAPASLDDLLAYAAATAGALAREACRLLGAGGEAAMAAADDVGTAWALVGLLRALPAHLHARRLLLPEDLLARHGVALRDLVDLGRRDGLPGVAAELAGIAHERLDAARARRAAVPRTARSALSLAALARGHLRRLERLGFDPLHQEFAAPLPFAAWRVALASRFGG